MPWCWLRPHWKVCISLFYCATLNYNTQPRGSSFQEAKLQFADVQLALKEASGTVVFNSAGNTGSISLLSSYILKEGFSYLNNFCDCFDIAFRWLHTRDGRSVLSGSQCIRYALRYQHVHHQCWTENIRTTTHRQAGNHARKKIYITIWISYELILANNRHLMAWVWQWYSVESIQKEAFFQYKYPLASMRPPLLHSGSWTCDDLCTHRIIKSHRIVVNLILVDKIS